MTNEQFDSTIESVKQRLPSEVVTALTEFWDSTPTTVPSEGGELPAPQYRLLTGSPKPPHEARGFLRFNPHPGCLAFNGDFLAGAPIEVVETVIAEALADSYLKITDPTRFPWERAATEEALVSLLSNWGFNFEETKLYLAAQSANPLKATASYYALRFATYGKPPHPSADIESIIAVLKEKECGHLEAALRCHARNKVRVFDFSTEAISEIPVSELAPGYVLARVQGVDGPVYVNIHQTGVVGQREHGGLSKEFKRVIRHCMKLIGDADPRTFEEHQHDFLLEANPQSELTVYFRSALVFSRFKDKPQGSLKSGRRLWQWVLHCSMTEAFTVMETWTWETGERELLKPVADYYYSCDYEAKFKKLFDPEKVFPLPLNSAKEK